MVFISKKDQLYQMLAERYEQITNDPMDESKWEIIRQYDPDSINVCLWRLQKKIMIENLRTTNVFGYFVGILRTFQGYRAEYQNTLKMQYQSMYKEALKYQPPSTIDPKDDKDIDQ